jgi:hypothetical protein
VLSQCTYYEYAYSGTDAPVAFVPVPTVRDAAYFDAETGGGASTGPTYPQKTWYPCLSCAGLSWTSNSCPEAGLPDVRPSSDGDAPSNTVDVAVTGDANQPDIPVDGNRGGLDATVTGDANQPDIPVGGNPGGLDAAVAVDANKPVIPGGGKRGGGCVVGGWLSTRALAPWALAGLFAALVTVIRRRRPKGH